MLPSDFTKYTEIATEEWLEGTVVSIMNYGAFVRLDGDVDGMVHISQLDPHGERVDSVYNAVEVCFVFVYLFLGCAWVGQITLGVMCFRWPCVALFMFRWLYETIEYSRAPTRKGCWKFVVFF